MKIEQRNHLIIISQTHYINSLLQKFKLENADPVSTPLNPNLNLDEDKNTENINDEGEQDPRGSFNYATLIGSLMYLALGTQPKIAYAVNRLAQFTQNPKPKQWTAVKRIFQYLKGTWNHALTYSGSDDLLNQDLNFFCDSDWASDADKKSVSGYIITDTGDAVAWSSKKQTTVALSTAEAEYIASTHAAKQVLWHRSLFKELDFDLPKTLTIFSNNQAAVSISHHLEFHTRTKHINILYHFL